MPLQHRAWKYQMVLLSSKIPPTYVVD